MIPSVLTTRETSPASIYTRFYPKENTTDPTEVLILEIDTESPL